MELRITIADERAGRVGDAICERHGYTGVDEAGAPQTKMQFVRQWMITTLKAEVQAHEEGKVTADARRNVARVDF